MQVALVGANHVRESIPDEDYWQAVWPNTPIPSTLKELLKPGAEGSSIAIYYILANYQRSAI